MKLIRAHTFFSVLFAALLSACSNMMPAQGPQHSFEQAHTFGATALAFSTDGKTLVSGGYQGEISLWHINPPEPVGNLAGHHDSVRAIEYLAPDRLASGDDEGHIILWNLATLKPLIEIKSSAVTSMGVTTEGIITGHRDGWLRMWRLPDLKPVGEINLQSGILSLVVHGNTIAVSTNSGRVEFYNPQLELLRQLQAHGSAAHDLRFSPDGTELAAGSWFRMLLWDVKSGEQKSIPTEHNGLLTSVDFSPDGKHMVSLGRHTDSAIRVWRRDDLTVERRYQAHQLCGAMIRFSPDGHLMASASDDESVRLYDLTLPYLPQ